jgi:hypothetical protein
LRAATDPTFERIVAPAEGWRLLVDISFRAFAKIRCLWGCISLGGDVLTEPLEINRSAAG